MTPPLLDLHVTTLPGHSVVEVAGEIDLASAGELRDCLHRTIDSHTLRLVIDLREVTFIDSVGLGILVGARRRLLDRPPEPGQPEPAPARSIQLVCGEGLVVRLLRLTGLSRIFPLHATVSDALSEQAHHDQEGAEEGSAPPTDRA